MKALIPFVVVLLWCLSYWIVITYTNKYLKERNIPVRVENYAPEDGKMRVFLVAPIITLWILWIELKAASIYLFVKILDLWYTLKEKQTKNQ